MTAQNPDSIVVDGREGVLLDEPLANLLDSLEGVPPLVAPHTACWRGYVARWHVSDDVLYLDDVTGWVADGREVGAREVLPGVTLPLKATWVSWSLRVAFGDQIQHVHAGYESTYEDEVLLEVSAGEVVARRSLIERDNPPVDIRTPSTDELRRQWPTAPEWPAEPAMPPPPGPFDRGYIEDGVLVPPGIPRVPPTETTTNATVDRVLIAAVDHLLSSGTTDEPSTDGSSEVVVADAQAIVDALEAVTEGSRLGISLFGFDGVDRVFERLHHWARAAIVSMDRNASMPTAPLPGVADRDQVARACEAMWGEVEDDVAPSSSGFDDDSEWEPWTRLRVINLSAADVLWAAASLVTCLVHQRANVPDEYRGTLAPVLDELGSVLPGGNLAWKHPAGAKVARPERHRLRAFFDPGTGVLVWIDREAGAPRWDYDIDHRDLPIPMALADQLDVLLARYDETIPLREPERPLEGAEATLFRAAFREVFDRLRAALGPAYVIEDHTDTE